MSHRMRTKKLTWADAFKIAIFSSFASIIIFLMIEVFAAQLIKDYVLSQLEDENNIWVLVIIILSGYLLGLIISIISGILASELISKKYTLIASALAFLINLVIWILWAYAVMIYRFDLLAGTTAIEKIVLWPRVLAYYSIYGLNNVTTLWLLGQLTYCIIFAILLKVFGARKKSGKYNYQFN